MIRPILVALALTSPAFARIGETPEQCEARYGKPVETREISSTYRKGGVIVDCWFIEGRCAKITFQTIQATTTEKDASWNSFTEDHKSQLMAANSGGERWVRNGGTEYAPIFKTSDGSRNAKLGSGMVTIESESWKISNLKLIDPAEIAESIKGF